MVRHARHALIAAIAIGATPGVTHAGGLDTDLFSPRAIARAGAIAVSEDGAAALLINPAGMVRRGGTRLQLGIALADRDASYRSSTAAADNAPTITDRGPPSALPLVGLQYGFGRVVLGVTYADTGALSRALPEQSNAQPPADVTRLFPHRYGGVAMRYRKRNLAVGGAIRAADWLGVGVSITASSVELGETRGIWAGFDGRDNIDDPSRDLRLAVDARDRFVPGFAAGLLIAPPQVPMELALSVETSADAALSGNTSVTRVSGEDFPRPELGFTSSQATLASPTRLRAGLRYLGDRLTVELGGELVLYRGSATPTWGIGGVIIRDETGRGGELTEVDSLVSQRDHAAVRAAVDVEIVRGFLWLIGGYALRTAATARSRVSPVFGDLGGHTVGVGAETNWQDVTLTIGYARTIAAAVRVDYTTVYSVNPFDAGTRPAALGRYDRAQDLFGASVEVAW